MQTSPFGIRFFSPISDYETVSQLQQGMAVITPPNAHPLFSEYYVQVSGDLGVVWIKAFSNPIENDAYGRALTALVDRVASQLTQKYGEGDKTDLLFDGSIWNEPQDWSAALAAKERFYSYMWERPKSKKLPEDLASIFIGALMIEQQGFAVIEYASSKLRDAEAEVERDLSALL